MGSELPLKRRWGRRTAGGEPHARTGLMADFVLGWQDGMVNVLGIVLGVTAASQNIRLLLVGGLAAAFAEAISMGAVAYTSTLARRDQYLGEREREKQEMREVPAQERGEVRQVLRGWGFEGPGLEEMTERIVANPKAWLEFMMAYELKLAPVDKSQGRRTGVIVGVSTLVGSLIPLAPFPLVGNIAMGAAVSVVVSALALYLIGWYGAKLTVGRPGRSGLQMALIGTLAGLAGFAIGLVIGAAPGG